MALLGFRTYKHTLQQIRSLESSYSFYKCIYFIKTFSSIVGNGCESEGLCRFLFFANLKNIYRIQLQTSATKEGWPEGYPNNTVSPVLLVKAKTHAITVDPVHKRLLWHDHAGDAILQANFNGTNIKTMIHLDSSITIFSMIVDPYMRKLYMSDLTNMMSVELSGKNLQIIARLIPGHLDELALDYQNG